MQELKKKEQTTPSKEQKSSFLSKWVWMLLLIATAVVAIYFLSGLLRWITPLLLLFAYAGAENIKDGLIAVVLIGIASLVVWFFIVSPEYKAGMAAYDKGDYTSAIKHFNTELAKDPAQPDVLLAQCKAKRKSGHPEQALPDCNRAIDLGYDDKSESYAVRARIYSAMGMNQKALDDFTIAIQHNDWSSYENLWYLLYERGIINLDLGRNDTALDNLKKAYRLNDEWYPVWVPIGNAYFNKGEKKKALQAYEKYMLHYNPKEDSLPEGLKKRIMKLQKQAF